MVLSNTVQDFLFRSNVKHSDLLIVAISGGMDSMLLWDTVHKLGYKTIGVHINYKLRNEDSDQDEKFVRDYALKHKLPLQVFTADPENFRDNLQEKARDFRYKKFEDVRNKHNANFVLTAHHANDDAETFFVNLIRGAGIGGLKSISQQRDYFLRPFLQITKKQLLTWAQEINLNWREDKSNASDKYLRNKIRHHVLPEFIKLDLRAESGLHSSLKILKSQNKLYQFFIEKYRSENITTKNGLIVLKLTEEILKLPQLLFELLLPFGNFNALDIISASTQSGKQFISETHTVWVDRNQLLIEENKALKSLNEKLKIEKTTHKLNDFKFEFFPSLPKPFKPNQSQAWLNADLLEFPLTLRTWQKGDKFQPFGMKGKKKISDYLNDIKMPVPLKKEVRVLENKGEIIWLVDHRIDERFKVNKSTKLVYFAELIKS